jgi:membrane protein DedA with SNARE-associated domain
MNGFRTRKIPTNFCLLSLAITGATLGLITILDFPEIPSSIGILGGVPHFLSVFSTMTTPFLSMGYLGLFVSMFLESMALPIPSEVVLPFAGYLIRTGSLNFSFALAVSTIASLFGSLIIYLLALKLSSPVIYSFANRVGIGREKIARLERWMSGRYGSSIVLSARFVPGIRSSISIPAGSLRMNLTRFLLITLIGSFGWSVLLMYVGYSASPFLPKLASLFLSAASCALTVTGIGYIAYFAIMKNHQGPQTV